MRRVLRSIGSCSLLLLPACGTITSPTTPSPYGDLQPLALDTSPGTVAADQHTGLQRGDWNVTLAGSGSNNDSWNAGAASLTAGAGYMVTDTVELGLRQWISMDNPPGGGTDWNGSSRAAIDLHLPLEVVYPFIGANFGAVYGGSVADTWIAAPEAGVKWFLKPDAFLLAMVEYQILFDEFDDFDNGWHDGQFVYMLGFGLRF